MSTAMAVGRRATVLLYVLPSDRLRPATPSPGHIPSEPAASDVLDARCLGKRPQRDYLLFPFFVQARRLRAVRLACLLPLRPTGGASGVSLPFRGAPFASSSGDLSRRPFDPAVLQGRGVGRGRCAPRLAYTSPDRSLFYVCFLCLLLTSSLCLF